MALNGTRTVDSIHRELGRLCGTTAGWNETPVG